MNKNTFINAALLVAGAMMAACSGDSDIADIIPAEHDALLRTPVTISARYGGGDTKAATRGAYGFEEEGGFSGGEATAPVTRVAYEENGNRISATWQAGDQLLVVADGQVSTLTLKDGAGTTSATFTGTIAHTHDLTATTQLICYVKDAQNPSAVTVNGTDGTYQYNEGTLTTQDGTVGGAASCNVYYGVTHYGDGSDISCNFSVNTSMMKFTVSAPGLTTGQATLSYKSEGTTIAAATFDIAADGTNTVYLAIPAMHLSGVQALEYKTESDANATVTATAILSETQANFAAGQTYSKRIVFLSPATEEVTVPDGIILCGTGGGLTQTGPDEWVGTLTRVTIAAGATVTFSNLTVGQDYGESAGITCAGDATIKLVGTNKVQANMRAEAGIFIPSGSTLTIQGTGSLHAEGGNHPIGVGGAGIGGYCFYNEATSEAIAFNCGHIVIKSGTVTAMGHSSCAGIGSGDYASCDGITINGGTITAIGSGGAGIGSGGNGSCSNITIKGGIVTATGGINSAGIGCGKGGSCGNITIATGIASVTAIVGRWDGDNNEPKPIGEGSDYNSLGTVTFDGETFDWSDLDSETYYYNYGALTLSITEENINKWDPDWEEGMAVEWRDTWTLTPTPDPSE